MKSFLVRCYPAAWRARYGDEFEAILEERALGPFDVADVLLGAFDAWLRLRGHRAGAGHARGVSMSLRIGGIAAVISSSIWVILLVQTSSLNGQRFGGTFAIGALAALVALLVAVTGLSAYQARSHPRLVWTAFTTTAIGTVAVLIGAAAELTPVGAGNWNDNLVAFGGLIAFVGSGLFGIATYRISVLSRGAASLLVAGPVIGVAVALLALVSLDAAYPFFLVASLCFPTGWFALGIQAIRLDHPATSSRPA